MAITVKHSKVSTIPDDADTSLVRPSDWNADHTLVGTVPVANGGTGAATLTGYVKGNGTSAMTASATVPSTDVTGLGTMSTQNSNNISVTGGSMSGVTISDYIPTTQKAAALGVATLDSSTKVPISQIPDAVIGALNYQGTWNAATNTPTLTSSVGTKGYYYVVSVAGSTNLNGTTDWLVGDWAVYNGTIWQKIDNTDSVTSVNGFTGAVVLTTTNVAEGTNLYYTDARARASVSAGTGISYNSTTGVITNSSPSLGGDVVGPASATDNAIARFDSTTGKLLQNSVVTVGDTGAVSGVTTLSASTSVTTPIVQATNSGGLVLKNSGGTTQISVGAGGGDNMSINVSTNINGTNAQIDISPTGTGHVHIKPSGTNSVEIAPTSVGTINNMTIGATTAVAGSFTDLSVTGTTSFDGSQGTAGQVLTSAGTGATPTWTTPTTGTVTSVTGTSPVVSSGGTTPAISMPAATSSVNGYLTSTDWSTFNGKGSGTVTSVGGTGTVNGISLSGTVTSSGNLTLGGTLSNVSLATQVTGNLPVTNLNSGTSASASTFWRGDGAWATPAAGAGGSTTQVQYNNAGALAGSSGFVYNTTTQRLDVSGTTGGFIPPNGTTAERNGTPVNGELRFNTTLSQLEAWSGVAWVALTASSYTANFLVIAGGGGGSWGGGGAGGYRTSAGTSGGGASAETALTFVPSTVYTITVGAGGAAGTAVSSAATSGNTSSVSGTGITTISSTGGGKGSQNQEVGGAGGSGGGASNAGGGGGSGTTSQGYAGGTFGSGTPGGAGGGGAGAVGGNGADYTVQAGSGGTGVSSSITGTAITRGGGGGGGGRTLSSSTGGSGGSGGGGAGGGASTGGNGAGGTAGTVNTGGGGGGGSFSDTTATGQAGGSGGSGVVILSVPTARYSGVTTGSPTISTNSGNTILIYTSSGTYTG